MCAPLILFIVLLGSMFACEKADSKLEHMGEEATINMALMDCRSMMDGKIEEVGRFHEFPKDEAEDIRRNCHP